VCVNNSFFENLVLTQQQLQVYHVLLLLMIVSLILRLCLHEVLVDQHIFVQCKQVVSFLHLWVLNIFKLTELLSMIM